MERSPPVLDAAAIAAARRLVAIARERYPVVEAWLYGSHARGEARADSDVDVAIVVHGPRIRMWTIGGDLAGEAFDVLMDTGMLISPMALSARDWAAPSRFTNPFLIHNIQREGVAL